MRKFLLFPLMLLALWTAPAVAAADDPKGTVVTVEGNQVTVTVAGEMPTWARIGTYVKATDADGKVALRRGKIAKIDGNTIQLTSAEAKNLKPGKAYKLAKARVNEGC